MEQGAEQSPTSFLSILLGRSRGKKHEAGTEIRMLKEKILSRYTCDCIGECICTNVIDKTIGKDISKHETKSIFITKRPLR